MTAVGTAGASPFLLKFKIPARVAALAWCIFIFWLSSRPAKAFPDVAIPQVDKIVHVCLYAPLGFFAAAGYRPSLLCWVLCIAYGLSDETHQLYVPTRTFSLLDLTADSVGAAIGILIYARCLALTVPLSASTTTPTSAHVRE